MMKARAIHVIFFFFFTSNIIAQHIKGIVLDAQTNAPIETAAIYFNNTTIGTSTNDKGEFEIGLKEGVTSPLVISFLGYEKAIIENYNPKQFYKIFLKESAESLDEVVISTNDGMPKKVKLQQFTEQFLGFSKFAKSCEILNKEALILRYDKKSKQLTASAIEPIVVVNNDLQYKVNFDIIDFVIDYKYVDVLRNEYVVNSMFYSGTSFFDPIENRDVKQTKKNRDIAYKGSALHFMRALSQKQLKEEKYAIYSNGFRVDPDKYISVEKVDSSQSYNIKLRAPLSVLYKRKLQSEIELPPNINGNPKMAKLNSSEIKNGHISINASKRVTEDPYFNVAFVIDYFGNYSPIGTFYFVGHMGNQRVGDSLPFDYELPED
ncbi:MAG: carboxypeptidase-like regulatory domain-containing protein [Psychroserpens sp.]|nr:carboxypeptidase-like regulatory domain-containing protein [Psychroserpens sp.]